MPQAHQAHILYSKIPEQLTEEMYKSYLIYLPQVLRDKHFRYRRSEDRMANLFSKMLLLKGLERYGLDYSCLDELLYNEYDRPYIPGKEIDFNISHSSKYAMCAIAKNGRVGIDVEYIKEVDFRDFETLMTGEQWMVIKKSIDPLSTFFKYWAIKESIIKADGRGLSIPLNEIEIADETAFYEQKWWLKNLDIDEDYAACVAADFNISSVMPERIDLVALVS